MARIIVCGYMIRHPVVGLMYAYFHYVLGLHRLGHEIVYVEESGWPLSCYNPFIGDYSDEPTVGMKMTRMLMDYYGIRIPICYVNSDTGKVYGSQWKDVKSMLTTADLLLNIGGVCWLPEFLLCHRRAYIDMDPLFTQVGRMGVGCLNDHHIHFSYGVNIGQPGCSIPTCGIDWLPTIPPVVPEIWPGSTLPKEKWHIADSPFTTIANWDSYGAVNYSGENYGQKDEEFLGLIDLPMYNSQPLELALSGIKPDIKTRLLKAGWLIREAGIICKDLDTYQAYIASSRGEFSVAKNAYVKTHSGWFSDRSICYMAAGRPVILQDTGFSNWLPTGRGVLAFSSVEEASDCIEKVNAEYQLHCKAARGIAQQTFNYKFVLPRLLDNVQNINANKHSSFKARK